MALDTYDAALAYLFSATDYEKMRRVRYNADTFSLDRMRRLLRAVGSPEERLAAVHVAGTKGKGSTAAMVHALALAAGLRSGLYTSPHLVDIRERIRVGSEMIAPEALRRLIDAARPHVESLRADGDPLTFFEIFTALALRHFADVAVDVVVVEVGLGGRLDATNVLTPDVAVLTAVSIDHTHQLGDSLAAIAAEKAGIVKPGVPVVCQAQPPEALEVIEATCRRREAPLVLLGRDVTVDWQPEWRGGRPGGRLAVHTPGADYEDLSLPLMGEHQAANAAAALAAAQRASPLSPRLTPDLAREAFASLDWPGRMEYVPGKPEVVLDGAHNRASMACLVAGLHRHFPGRPPVFVFAAAADKDIDGMLEVLADSGAHGVVFTRTHNPRAADPADLAARFAARGGAGAPVCPDAAAALREATRRAGPDGLVVVCGSLYLVGEVKGLAAT